jgi:hypothetical protein
MVCNCCAFCEDGGAGAGVWLCCAGCAGGEAPVVLWAIVTMLLAASARPMSVDTGVRTRWRVQWRMYPLWMCDVIVAVLILGATTSRNDLQTGRFVVR